MKTCLICGEKCPDDLLTCPKCGEGSWGPTEEAPKPQQKQGKR